MNLLPIARRELLTAARKRSMYRGRWWTALVAMGITIVVVVSFSLTGAARGSGQLLFKLLTGYALVLSLLIGVLLTADALAQEKREGTLGLLFLADLKGYGIVLGKFVARSLNAAYALLAILPAIAMPLILGGVEGAEVFRVALALLNALFLSLSAGIFVSAFARESDSAVGNGVGLVVVLAAVLPAITAGLGWVGAPPAWQSLGWLSPAFAYFHASPLLYRGNEGTFWAALASVHLLGWVLLVVASLWLPRTFQEKPVRSHSRGGVAVSRPAAKARTAPRGLLARNPVLWLRCSELGTPWAAWLVVGFWAVATVLIFAFGIAIGSSGGAGEASLQVEAARPFGFFLKLLFAASACRFFVDARRNGTLELLLCTPLSSQDIIRGQMSALLRTYGPPFVSLLFLLFMPVFLRIATGIMYPGSERIQGALGAGVIAAGFTLRMAADLMAIVWLGTALALTARRATLAPFWTILLVLIIPAPLSFCWLDTLIDLVLISWGTNRCRLDLRRLVAEQYQVSPRRTI